MPADVATPLAVVLAELVQNAIEHAFLDFEAEEDGDGDGRRRRADRDLAGTIRVDLSAEDGLLRVEVLDDGSGLPDGFDIDETQSLGLSIVRDLVRSQLDGTIAMVDRRTRGRGGTAPSWSSSCRHASRSRSASSGRAPIAAPSAGTVHRSAVGTAGPGTDRRASSCRWEQAG